MEAEAELLQRARRGDLDAFNGLVTAYEGTVYSLCYRLLGQRQAAEDATQETFLAAWRGIGGLRGANFRPWLLRIAANACRDELRRRSRRPAASLDVALAEGTPEPADPAPSPEASALQTEARSQLEALLSQWPAEQRLALLLCDVEGLDYAEIALVMRTSLGTVKSRIARGRGRLRRALMAEGEPLVGRLRPKG